MTGPSAASLPVRTPAGRTVGGFTVIDETGAVIAGPFPGFDIAMVVARQADFRRVAAQLDSAMYEQRLRHARRWSGSCVARWLAAGMPALRPLPAAPDLDGIDARLLARNGDALIDYLEAGPEAPARPFYDRLVARYALAAHGTRLAPATARVALETVHASQAMRRLCQDFAVHRVAVAHAGMPVAIGLSEAAARLRLAAHLYRGLGPNWLHLDDAPGTRGRWARYCRRSVLLPGVDTARALVAARRLLAAADVRHGIDENEPSRALRHVLLHLAQWLLVSEDGGAVAQSDAVQAGL